MVKNIKFTPLDGSSSLNIGDLVRVQYRDKASYEVGWAEEKYLGFITKVPPATDDNPAGMTMMWCIGTSSTHIISPRLDRAEVISAAG